MAIEIPDDWPARRYSEDSVLGHLETIDTDAPSGTVPTRWQVASWSTTREMRSASIPGQVRHQTGLSIGTGKAVLKRDRDDYPWKQSLVYELTGQHAQILLAPQGATEIPTAQFQVADVDGDVTTVGVPVELDERTVEGKDQAPGVLDQQWASDITQEEINAQAKDPVWLLAELAEQMGFRSGPNVTPGQDGYSPILDVPLQGSLVPRLPLNVPYSTSDTISWGTSEGSVGLSTENDNTIMVMYEVNEVVPTAFTITLDLSNAWAGFEWNDVATNGRFGVQVQAFTGDSTVNLVIYSTGSNGTGNTTTNIGPLDITRNPDIPNRIQIEVTLTPASGTGFNSASVRLRRREGFWFGPYVHAMGNQLSRVNNHNIEMETFTTGLSGTAILSNYSVIDHAVNSAAVRTALLTTLGGDQGRIYLEPLIGTITSPWLDPNLSLWTTMQQLVEAWQGALITDVYGDLKVLNRNTLAGLNNLQQERIVDVGLKFEDLPWRMNWSDQADRLVIRYRPVVEVKAEPTQVGLPVIYEFQEKIIAWPGSNEVFFTLDYLYPTDLKLLPFNRKDQDNGVFHVWDAYRYNNGTGNHIDPNTEIGMRIDRVSSAVWKVFIDNRTSQPFHMVDNTGTPYLKIRSSWYWDQTKEAFLERGVAASDARSALEIDLGHYVQNEDDANALADFIWARVNQRAWRAQSVNMVPDYRLDLGDVVELVHARTGMRSNAIVTKLDAAGDPGGVTQKVDFTLMPPTWEDFDENWANAVGTGPGGLATWTDFDNLWDAYTWADFDRTPTATTVAQIEEGM